MFPVKRTRFYVVTSILISFSLCLPWYHFHDYDTWGSGWFIVFATFLGPGWSLQRLFLLTCAGFLVATIILGVQAKSRFLKNVYWVFPLGSLLSLVAILLTSTTIWLWGIWGTTACVTLALICSWGQQLGKRAHG